MKKHRGKWFLLVVAAIILVGCNVQHPDGFVVPTTGEPVSGTDSISTITNDQMMYHVDTTDSFTENFSVVHMTNDSIIGGSIEGENPIITVVDKAAKEEKLKETLPYSTNDVYISCLTTDIQGVVYILLTDYADKGFNQYVWKMDDLGNLTQMAIPSFEDTIEKTLQSIQKIEIDNTGTFYFWLKGSAYFSQIKEDANFTQEKLDEINSFPDKDTLAFMVDRIYVKDDQLNTLYYANIADSNVVDISLSKDGIPQALVRTNDGLSMRELDTSTHKFKDAVPLMQTNAYELSLIVSFENGFFYTQGDGLFQYENASSTSKKLLTWSTYGINPSEILYLSSQNGSIEVIDNSNTDANTQRIVLKEGSGEKIVLTLGVLDDKETIKKTVRNFNSSNSKYTVVIENYNQDNDYDRGLEALKLDIVTGNAPDIMDVSTIDYAVLANKGVFADLNTFMSKDSDCNQDTLVDSVIKAYDRDGHIYALAPAFQLFSIWGKTSVTGNKNGVTLKDLMELLQKQGKDINAIFGFGGDEPVMTSLCLFGMNELIDWSNMSCDFTGDYFKDLAFFAKEFKGYIGSTSQGIKDGEILLTVSMISSVADYQLQEDLYGADISFVGYPTTSGTGTSIGFRGGKLAINGSSAHQEAAWEFLKFYLQNGYDGHGFPIRKDLLDKVLLEAQEPIIVTDMDGTYEQARGLYVDADILLQVYAASADDVAAVRQLIDEATYRHEYNADILGIIQEEITPYLSGSKPIDVVVDAIQNRVQLYLDEQKD
ncbi:MAG: extracellular solute-binding protein [Clostridium sp.]|jgi:ABC-type glycerol-3-phosphate transport system substrate-binding protein|nr:extracellular solute-binding protein [Clostridium sp.]